MGSKILEEADKVRVAHNQAQQVKATVAVMVGHQEHLLMLLAEAVVELLVQLTLLMLAAMVV